MSGLRSATGLLQACLTTRPDAFPGCSKDPAAIRLRVPAEKPHLRFTGIAPGLYAIAIVHDENGNGKVDMALFLPREGVGASLNPPVRMGPPTFRSAAFKVGESNVSLSVTMKYIL